MSGWIKLHRRLLEWGWYKDPAAKVVFLHLLLTARREPGQYLGHDVPEGANIYGRKQLTDALGLSEKQVRNALEKLEKTREVGRMRAGKFSIISITKWDDYQGEGHVRAANRATSGPQTGPDEGHYIRKGEDKKKEDTPIVPRGTDAYPEDFETFWSAFPRRKGTNPKKSAFKKWQGYVKGGTPSELILQGARGYAAARAGQDAQFTQQAVTWLNQAGWEQYAQQPAPRLVHPAPSEEQVSVSWRDDEEAFDFATQWHKSRDPVFSSLTDTIKIPKSVLDDFQARRTA